MCAPILPCLKLKHMKKQFYFLLLISLPYSTQAQNVGIGTTTPISNLEVKNPSRAAITISSANFSDTTQLVLKNRSNGNLGTDMILNSNREDGIRITSKSDLTENTHDSIMLFTPQGRVGINNTNPQERLDVRGNINISGSIKANGVDGGPNQLLMKDDLGNMTWGDLGEYKNFESYTSAGSFGWVVPTNITKIMVEMVGGGGGGLAYGGGAGGGYMLFLYDVTPGTTLNFVVGAGGGGGTTITSSAGGNTTFNYGALTLYAMGGSATTYDNTTKVFESVGGSFQLSTSLFKKFIAANGVAGHLNKITFEQKSATSFFEISEAGNGGGPGNCRTCVGKGVYIALDITAATVFRKSIPETVKAFGTGGGGGHFLNTPGAGFGGGGNGTNGVVIIHY
jgi:hypothetical protein